MKTKTKLNIYNFLVVAVIILGVGKCASSISRPPTKFKRGTVTRVLISKQKPSNSYIYVSSPEWRYIACIVDSVFGEKIIKDFVCGDKDDSIIVRGKFVATGDILGPEIYQITERAVLTYDNMGMHPIYLFPSDVPVGYKRK